MDQLPPVENDVPPVETEAEAAARYQYQLELLATAQLKRLSDEHDANIFVYSGDLDRENAPNFIECVERVDPAKRRSNAILVACTFGGDIDAAYIIARHLKRRYQKFILFVFGHCKSAGTLLALGANELYVSHNAEFGPLDVQLRKEDELGARNSGLDIRQSLASLQEAAYNMFTRYFFGLKFSTSGAMTTKTAAEIASSLTVGLLSPITAQLDPLRIGEFDRAVNVAIEYGHRLSGEPFRVDRLVSKYSTHSFVIDVEEAQEIFSNVRLLTGEELSAVEFAFQVYLSKAGLGQASLRFPWMGGAVITYIDLPESEPVRTGESIEEQPNESRNQDDPSATDGSRAQNSVVEESTSNAEQAQAPTPSPIPGRSSKAGIKKPGSAG
jgi:hypothetical protein